MGRTTGTVGTARATGTASMTGGLPDTGTGPPRTSCSKLEKQSDVCIRFHFWHFFLLQTLNFGLIWPQHFRPIVLWDWDAQCQTSNGGFPEQRDPASRMLCSQLLGDGPVAYSYSLSVHNLHPDILGNVLVLAMVQSLESGQIDCVSGRLSFMQVTSREGS